MEAFGERIPRLALRPADTLKDEIRARLRERLSPRRYQHSLGVAAKARELAERHGADADQAELAGLLHDVAREWPAHALLERGREMGVSLGYLEQMSPMPCLHGPVGAELAAAEFGVADDGVLQAIASHTIGRERMTLLERVVFLADAIEPNRTALPYIVELRELAEHDLDLACRRAFDHTFEYLLRTRQPIHPQAAAARNWLLFTEKEKRS